MFYDYLVELPSTHRITKELNAFLLPSGPKDILRPKDPKDCLCDAIQWLRFYTEGEYRVMQFANSPDDYDFERFDLGMSQEEYDEAIYTARFYFEKSEDAELFRKKWA